MKIDKKLIKELVDCLGEFNITEIEYQDGGKKIKLPFTPGRGDATQDQTDIHSFGLLKPLADGFRNYAPGDFSKSAEEILIDKAQLMQLTGPEMTVLIGGMRVLDTNFDGFGIHTSDRESVFQGIGLGLIFGSSSAFFITSSVGQTIEGILPEDPTTYLIPVFGSFWRVVLLGIISQSLITLLTMILGVPKGLDIYEQEQADIVRKRITGSLIVPLGAIFSGGVISVFISQVFINFHDYATLFALIISATVLLFAAVMSSAPKIKITRNEVLIASAGILTLIVIIASVAASQH